MRNLVDAVFSGINVARKAATFTARTLDSNTIIRDDIAERNIRLDVDGVPADRDESLARVHLVRTSDVRGPVAMRFVFISPNASIFSADTRWVDVIAITRLAG